jgi:Fe2+ transport system protein FeoA
MIQNSMATEKEVEAAAHASTPTSRVTTEQSLAELPIGARARVIAVTGSGAIARRLLEMGVVPGAPVRVIKTAPLGDPLEVRIRGYHLALRRTEAQTITVVMSDK